jgi:hypothetical protein
MASTVLAQTGRGGGGRQECHTCMNVNIELLSTLSRPQPALAQAHAMLWNIQSINELESTLHRF